MTEPGVLRLLWMLLAVSVVLVVLGFLLESWTIPGARWWEFWKPKAEGLGSDKEPEAQYGDVPEMEYPPDYGGW
jgi:hypothetical protein